jgi:carboxyl-terminal processing protease
MWPMIAGLGPILGEGLLGYFIGVTGAETAWSYRDGAAFSGNSAAQRVSSPYRLRRERPRVAVLSDNAVASPAKRR